MKKIPDTVAPYKRTATFKEDSVPKGLLADHRTKAGVWGVITVTAGRLEYTIPSSDEVITLEPGVNGIVEPDVPHRVKPLGTVEFHVEFYR
jgi:tellurite resistance-related uncharacterized protein